MKALFNDDTAPRSLDLACDYVASLDQVNPRPEYEVFLHSQGAGTWLISENAHFVMAVIGRLADSGEDSLVLVKQ